MSFIEMPGNEGREREDDIQLNTSKQLSYLLILHALS